MGLLCAAFFGGLVGPKSVWAQKQEVTHSAELDPAAVERGRELFFRKWQAGDKLSEGGDGLGPMFNAASCADCHNQGGPGGSGAKETNVDLLTIVLPHNKDQIDRAAFAKEMVDIHPGLVAGGKAAIPSDLDQLRDPFGRSVPTIFPSITLHKRSTNPAYDVWRADLVTQVQGPLVPWPAGIQLKITQRRTPALFGAALVDSIPKEAVVRIAAWQSRLRSGVHGSVSVSSTRNPGKFGWRGQTNSLRNFVMGACANELGLRVDGTEQAPDPLLEKPGRQPVHDLTSDQCSDLIAFVASLPPPRRREPSTPGEASAFKAGERIFTTVGCAQCHLPQLGEVSGIYSDLLLHDMGPELSDPANPANNGTFSSSSGAYYGGPTDVFSTVPQLALQLWRTPPLWGVAQAAPYLHDGRAPTLDAAVRAHGGEAKSAREKYAALTNGHRASLLAYLESLGVD